MKTVRTGPNELWMHFALNMFGWNLHPPLDGFRPRPWPDFAIKCGRVFHPLTIVKTLTTGLTNHRSSREKEGATSGRAIYPFQSAG